MSTRKNHWAQVSLLPKDQPPLHELVSKSPFKSVRPWTRSHRPLYWGLGCSVSDLRIWWLVGCRDGESFSEASLHTLCLQLLSTQWEISKSRAPEARPSVQSTQDLWGAARGQSFHLCIAIEPFSPEHLGLSLPLLGKELWFHFTS